MSAVGRPGSSSLLATGTHYNGAVKVSCPSCKVTIAGSAINVAKDVAFCGACEQAWSLSELIHRDEACSLDLMRPPKGVLFERTPTGFVLAASTRSHVALFMLPFMIVWSGGSLGGIYGSQILKGQFNLGQSLFGIPFVLGSLLFWSVTLMAIAGQVRLTVDGEGAEVFTGIGSLGRKRRFAWSSVRRAASARTSLHYPGGHPENLQLVLADGQEISFGSGLRSERRSFVERALDKLLLERSAPERLQAGTLSLPTESVDEGRLSVTQSSGSLTLSKD
jgi:hypothetical protein